MTHINLLGIVGSGGNTGPEETWIPCWVKAETGVDGAALRLEQSRTRRGQRNTDWNSHSRSDTVLPARHERRFHKNTCDSD